MGFRFMSILCLALLPLASSDLTVGTFNYLIDPGRVFQWRNSWLSTQIDLSKTNSGATGVTVSFYINLSTGLNNGFFEVTFPAGFDLTKINTAGYTVSGQVVQVLTTIPAAFDAVVTIPQVGNPSTVGPYGPFAVRTRVSPTGQVIDANLSFGTTYITSAAGSLGAVSVSLGSGSSIINQPGNTLNFQFTLGVSLWAHDLFKITVASQYTLVNPICRSVDTAGHWNDFNGTLTNDPHFLNCVVTGKVAGSPQVLWIYGLSTDADLYLTLDNQYVILSVFGFTNPDRQYPSSAYTWTIETQRFNTFNILESGSASGPATSVGTISGATWTPTWGRPVTSILQGQTIYMDMAITIANPLNDKGGSMQITHSGTTNSWGGTSCYIVTLNSLSATCSVTGGTTQVTGLSPAAALTTFVIRHLISFPSTITQNAILTVVTKSPEGYSIDTGASLAAFTPPTATAATAVTMKVLFQTKDGGKTNLNQAGGTGDSTLFLAFQLNGLNTLVKSAASTVTISCPIAALVPDDFQFGIPSTNLVTQFVIGVASTSTPDFTSATTFNNASPGTNGSSLTIKAGSMAVATSGITTYKAGTIVFTAGSLHAGTDFTVGLSVSSATAGRVSTSGALILPLIVSNPATVYECALDIVDTSPATPNAPARAVSQFTITTQDFSTNKFTYFCSNGSVAGAPVMVTFLPKVVDVFAASTTKTYYLDIELSSTAYTAGSTTSSFHSSGVTEGGSYPMDSNLSGSPSMIVTTDAESGTFAHRVTGMGLITTLSNEISIYFPVGTTSSSSPSVILRTFYKLATDNRFKFFTHRSSTAASYTIGTQTNIGTFFSFTGTPSQTNGSNLSTTPISFSIELNTALTATSYFYILLPTGYSFSSFKDVQTDTPSASSSFPLKKYFSSPNIYFKYPGILVQELKAGANISGNQASTISLLGLNLPIGTGSGTVRFVQADVAGDLTLACTSSGSGTVTLTSGKITTLTLSPTETLGRGPSAVDIAYTLIFVLPHGIDAGGSITLTMNTQWQPSTAPTVATTPGTQCFTLGLSNVSATQQVKCVVSGNSLTITQFADFNSATLTQVTIYITHMLPPVNAGSTDLTFQFFATSSSLTTKTSGGLVIDYFDITDSTVNFRSVVTVHPKLNTGLATYLTTTVFPSNAGTTEDELYLKVSFPFGLPANSVIGVSVPYTIAITSASLQNQCYVSPVRISSCVTSGTGFSITLDQAYSAGVALELFVNKAVTPPATVPTSSTTQYGFSIKAVWNSVTIIDDGSTFRSSQLIVPANPISGTITTASASTSILFTPTNAYEQATYTFSFQSSVAIAATDYLTIYFPYDFDPYLGAASQSYQTETGNFYIGCSCPQLGLTYCRLDHWMLIVDGTQAVAAATELTITVSGVRNPAAGKTGNFVIWHYNPAFQVLAINSAFGTVTPTALPAALIFRRVDSDSRNLSTTGTFTFDFYVSDTISSTTTLRIEFPPESDFSIVNTQTGYTCSTTYQDQTASATVTGEQAWNTSPTCTASGNIISVPGPTASFASSSTNRIRISIAGVPTPQWGQTRTPLNPTWDFDDIDPAVWVIYSWWTSPFHIYVNQSPAANALGATYSSRPYKMQNAAYLGFLQPLRTFSVNAYNPQNRSNRIIVYPGTQSQDVPITTANSTWTLEAKSMGFLAKTNPNTPDGGGLKYTSLTDAWVMLQDEWTINFRVAADVGLAKGLYYISWTLTEGKQPSVSTGWYSPPPLTLVEVPALHSQVYTFQLADIPPVPVGTTSIPVMVSISNPPHTEVDVNIAIQGSLSTISITPKTLVFQSDVDFLFFNITVNATHDFVQYPTATLLLNLTGTNKDQYAIAPAVTVPITKVYHPRQGKIGSLGISDVTRTSFFLSPSTDQLGIVYYMVSPRGSPVLSFPDLKAKLGNFTYSADQVGTIQTKSSTTRVANEADSDPPSNTTWNDFQHQLFVRHMTSYFVLGAIMMRTTNNEAPVSIEGLWADSVYQIVAYLDNLQANGTVSKQALEYVWTSPIADCQPVALLFSGQVSAASAVTIKNIYAKYVGVNPSRIQNLNYTTQTSRLLQANTTNTTTPVTPPVTNIVSSTFQFTLVANRALQDPTPTYATTFSNERLNDFRKELSSSLSVTLSGYTLLPVPTRVAPVWVVPAQVQSFTNTSIVMQYTLNVAGTVCCSALDYTEDNVLPDQAVEGYSFNWTKVPKSCGTAFGNKTVNTLAFQNMQPDTVYYLQCVGMDSYPLWPTLMTYTTALPLPFVTFHTPATDEPEILPISAAYLQVALAVLWLAFLNA